MNNFVPSTNVCEKQRPWKSLLALAAVLLFGLGVSQHAQAQSFGTCNARMFMDQVPTTTSTLYNVNYTTAPFTLTSLGSSTTITGRNGVGYNALDNYIYGIRWPAGSSPVQLIRVNNVGAGQNMGVIAGLPTGLIWNNGVISPAGDYYLKSGFSDTTLYRINLATTPYTAIPITLSQPVQTFDLAWHNGLLYGVDITTGPGRLVSIDPVSGAVTVIGFSSPLNNALAMWGFNNMLLASSGGSIYAIDPGTGAATLLSVISPSANNGDGANCPSANISFNGDLSVTKTNTPASGPNDLPTDTFNPGETRTYTIVVTNPITSFGAQNVTVSDPVPAGIDASTVSWTCANTSGGSRCGAASGTGALNDTALDLPSGSVATYQVAMTVPSTFTGNLSNTVTVTPPSYIVETNTANNTATDTDFPTGRLTIVKSVPSGQGTAFDFTQSGMPATATGTPNAATVTAFTLNPSVAAGSNLTATQTYTNVPPSTAITVRELRSSNIGQYSLVNIVCANAAGAPVGSTFPTSINNGAANGAAMGTATVTLVAGADVTCTFNNVRNPRIVIVKNTVGGNGTFTFTETSSAAGTSLSPASPINLVTSGGSATVNTTIAGLSGSATTNVTITEAVTAGFTLSSVSCTNLTTGTNLTTATTPSATVNLASRQVVLGGVATGSEVQCTFINTRQAAGLTITKTSNGPWTVGQTGVTYTLNVSNTGSAATSGTITVRDQLPTGIGIRPATGFSPAAGWTCSYSDEAAQSATTIVPNTGMLVTCTSATSIPVGGAVALTLPVVVTSTSPASVINYASIGGGGDPFNGGTAPTAGPGCTDGAHCTSATTSVTPSPPAPATCPAGAPVNLFSPAPFQSNFFTDNATQTRTATFIATAGNYTVGTGAGGRFIVDMNWRWSPGFPLPSNAATMSLRVNGTIYATMTTQAGYAGFATLVSLNGATLFNGTTTMETNRTSNENIWVTLPASVTTITSVEMVYTAGSTADDFFFSGPALYGCLAPADLTITKASTTSPVVAGDTITYSITVTNNGPSAANNAIVIDDWTTQPGLDCSATAVPPGTATCAASGTAGTQCPAPASVTPAGLQAGLAIPALPNGGIVTFTLQCAVTATGQ